MITLYDLAAKDPIKTWSPNPWKTRYVLNLKKLPYQTIYINLEDVDRVIKEAGIPSSCLGLLSGKPFHTVPSIVDNATGQAVTDSYQIAEYLDKQYPDTPKAFPPGTEALQAAFYHYFNQKIILLGLLFIPNIPNILTKESSLEYFHRTRPAIFGKPMDQLRPVGEELERTWENIGVLFDDLESWYAKSSGPFLVGDAPSFGDFTIAGFLHALKIIQGEESDDWKRLAKINNGRWVKLLSYLEKYASVEN